MKWVLRVALGLTAMVAAGLWLLPRWAPVQAEAWQPPPNPGLTGVFAPNQALSAVSEIAVGPAPEHVADMTVNGAPSAIPADDLWG